MSKLLAQRETQCQSHEADPQLLTDPKLNENNDCLYILYVDDEPSLLVTTKQILEMDGQFKVDTTTSTDEALKMLKKQSYDAVISDYEMPGKNGLQFLTELRSNRNNIPFVIFTGKGREEVAIEALNLGADGYFNKVGTPENSLRQIDFWNPSISRTK